MSFRQLIEDNSSNLSNADIKMVLRADLVYNVTEDLLVEMEKQDINKQQLSRKLGKSKAYVTQLLSGKRNMTLGSLSDICFHLNIEPKLKLNSYVRNEKRDSFEGFCDEAVEMKWSEFVSDSNIPVSKSKKHSQPNIIYREEKSYWENAA